MNNLWRASFDASIKRIFDFILALSALVILMPLMVPVALLIWLQDFCSPLYIAPRVGRNSRMFRMVKLRSMVMNADQFGASSIPANDRRITPIGHFIRRYKLDEFSQLWNVLIGDMSLVGPRPQVKSGTDVYTETEKGLLSVKPGITDFSSIVFADESEILKGKPDPDFAYDQLIRPWKSRLGLLYVDHSNLWLDIRLVLLTVRALYSRQSALMAMSHMLDKMGAPPDLVRVVLRRDPLIPLPPPGATEVVRSRDADSAPAEFHKRASVRKGTIGEAKAAAEVSPVSPKLQPRLVIAASFASLAGLAVTAVILYGDAPLYPYVIIEAPSELRITFLLQGQPKKSQCETLVAKVVDAVQSKCVDCKIVERHCLDELDPNQSQMLTTVPLDLPSARLAGGGVVVFGSQNPNIAISTCRESERQAAIGRNVSNFECHPPGQTRRLL